MKKLIITLGVSGMLLTGCVDLDQDPNSFPTPENIEYTLENTTALANGLYVKLCGGNYGFNCRTQLMGMGADDVMSGSYSKRQFEVDQLYTDPETTDGDSQTMWSNMYGLIQSSNQLIEGLTVSHSMSEETKKPFLGEAYFMRAYAHFYLVRWFGDVPAFTDSKCIKDFLGSTIIVRNSTEDIYKKLIIPDLQLAEEILPDDGRVSEAPNSTITKWAAKACLADVYLTMAGWPLKQTEYYAAAKDKAAEIIAEGGYTLKDHYEELWKEATKSEDKEHIFALNHSTTMYSQYGKSYLTSKEEGGWGDYVGDSAFYEKYPNDERKKFNYVAEFIVNKRKVDFRKSEMHSPAINKYRDYGTGSPQSLGITPIYRYADVLLMYAEAQNLADGSPNQLAYDNLNWVRRRANGGTYTEETPELKLGDLSKEEFDKAVFDERGWEFFSEFKRWYQLVRREKVYEMNQGHPKIKEGIDHYNVTSENREIYLLRLPSKEIEMCGFPQNPR